MTAMIKNFKTMQGVCGMTIDGCVNAAKRIFRELAEGWAESEAYWRAHPELRPVQFYH